jgi:2-polyprenyl-3-methyl-5-hydroxy-6-metoxy-1,4-benzoquinol methylase
MEENLNCRICGQNTSVIFRTKVLNKYDVNYHQCQSCRFIQTDYPYWLNEAYKNAITDLDIGLISRNIYLLKVIPSVIDAFFPDANTLLDFGGGYGMFVRMMRDEGYNFYRQDIHCENLFAQNFDISENKQLKIDVVTAFEVFEHLPDPLVDIAKMFEFAENIIFSTVLIPEQEDKFKNWWYLTPETGQHVSFYSKQSLQYIAQKYNSNFYSNNHNLHLFSKNKIGRDAIQKVLDPQKGIMEKVMNRMKKTAGKRPSLLPKDYDFILQMLKGKA